MIRSPRSRLTLTSTPVVYLLLLLPLMTAIIFLYVYVHPLAPIGMIVGLWFLYFAVKSPFFLLLNFLVFAMACLAGFIPLLGAIGAGKIISIGSLAVLVLSKALGRDMTIVRSSYYPWILILGAMLVISAFRGTDPPGGMTFFTDGFMKTMILFLLILNTITTRSQLVTLQVVLCLICSFWGGYAILGQILGYDPLTGGALIEGSRAGGVAVYADPNDLAQLILLSLPFMLTATIELRSWRRLVFGLCLLLSLGGILSTQSRGGLIGIAVAMGIVFSQYIKNKIVLAVVLVGFLLTAVALSGMNERESGGNMGLGELDDSAQHRLDAWKAGLRMVVRNPISGVGYNRFIDNVSDYATVPLRPMAPHNTFIQLVSEIGVIGGTAFFVMFFLSFKIAYLMRRKRKVEDEERPRTLWHVMTMSLFPGMSAYFTAACFLSSAWLDSTYVLLALAAICYNLVDLKEDKSDEGGSRNPPTELVRFSPER